MKRKDLVKLLESNGWWLALLGRRARYIYQRHQVRTDPKAQRN